MKGKKMNKKETKVREYDGKRITWEYLFRPDLVADYKRIKKKEYCDPFFWVITEVEDEKK
jgi:hypothetical protein|tara:strand:+ start:241 stop:420 length:180 start_codon:yes stop_codon:yes gene_type:complete